MKRRRAIVVGAALGCLAIFFMAQVFLGRGEPRYEGRAYSSWVSILHQPNSGAEEAIRHAGTNGIPSLLRLIEYELNGLDVAQAMIGSFFGARSTVDSFQMRRNAVRAFHVLGERAASAKPALLQLARERRGSLTLYPEALAGLGPLILPSIRPWLMEADLYLQFVAIRTLLCMADHPAVTRETKAIFPRLIELLGNTSDESWDARNAALELMRRFPFDPERAVPALIAMFGEKNEHLRGQSMLTLGAYGSTAKEALTPLRAMLAQSTDPRGAQFLKEVIGRIERAAVAPAR